MLTDMWFQSSINLIFIYGLILSMALPMVGMYFLTRKQGFIMDVAGHAYFGAYLLLMVIYAPLSYLSSFLISYLLAKSNHKSKIQESQANVMFLYIFFTVFMLAIVNFLKPEALDMLVFGNIFAANYINLGLLILEISGFLFLSYKMLPPILLEVLSTELSKGIYGKNKIEKILLAYLMLSFLILFHGINYFGILLTASISLLPYFTVMHFKRGLKQSILYTIALSLIYYIISFYISLRIDISLAVSYGIIAIVPLILLRLYGLLVHHKY